LGNTTKKENKSTFLIKKIVQEKQTKNEEATSKYWILFVFRPFDHAPFDHAPFDLAQGRPIVVATAKNKNPKDLSVFSVVKNKSSDASTADKKEEPNPLRPSANLSASALKFPNPICTLRGKKSANPKNPVNPVKSPLPY